MNYLPKELRVDILKSCSSIDDRVRRGSIGRLSLGLIEAFGHHYDLLPRSSTIVQNNAIPIIRSEIYTGQYYIMAVADLDCGHTTVTYKHLKTNSFVYVGYVGRLDRGCGEVRRYRHVSWPWTEDAWEPGQVYDPMNLELKCRRHRYGLWNTKFSLPSDEGPSVSF